MRKPPKPWARDGRRAKPVVLHRWCMKWRSVGGLDGSYVHLQEASSKQFATRKACKAHIDERYGYIMFRDDLRKYPHGWRLPTAVKVTVTIKEM